ncbi:5'/3'-nucleotidase SurE [Actinosynnema pretiosum subsp. pretiosum]|uniref:5'-nucleotidase n=1 Tax=Actinosynnema pretiosum subsp. pretiosum TaxID=103721 RepID=A0AA45L5S0_9PSEU|nr:5-nucleotidase SurE [Actinosynnema pretiosum subsp. pretiosum]QUF03695.1 5'/3'-nucleotidase SurE [Actinosynnema pretiosum subsp. pretiosum]
MRALVTNDDGIDSPGLLALARGAREHGWEVVVAAPEREASGTSAGLTAAGDHRSIHVERRDLDGFEAYAVAGHPGLIALVASRGGFGEVPDVVLSGVNRGANTGRAVLHSGTVGAVLTASVNDLRGMAVSLDVPLEGEVEYLWDSAVTVARGLFDVLAGLPDGAVLNVNAPNVADPGEPVRATLAEFGSVQTRVKRADEGTIDVNSVLVPGDLPEGSDAALLAAGRATVTPLRSVGEDLELRW